MINYDYMDELQNSLVERAQHVARQRETLVEAASQQLIQADQAVTDIKGDLEYFESLLEQDQEVRIVVVGGPAGTTIFPTDIVALGADRIRYEGRDQDGARVLVVQHVSQLNIMLKAAKVGEQEARRIGFHID